jgi:hypothetical protein
LLVRAEVIAESGLHKRQVSQYGDERGMTVAKGLLLGREHSAEQVQRRKFELIFMTETSHYEQRFHC